MFTMCVGISHHTAPVEIREKLSMNPAQTKAALDEMHEKYPDSELLILSTCNRFEFYTARPLHGYPRKDELLNCLAEHGQFDVEEIEPATYQHDNEMAIGHLFSVASGVDSMVLGENQIVSQLKQAYITACESNTCGKVLHRIFQSALATSKQVRSATQIGEGRVSVSSVAVDFASHLFDSLDDKTVLAIGAGKMTELTLRYFIDQHNSKLLVCNRSIEAAQILAEKYGGNYCSLQDLQRSLIEADIVISSTAACEPIITAKDFKPLIRKRRFRPIFIIDIAMPRDFDPAIGQLSNVYLYNLDDLQQATSENQALRVGELDLCKSIITNAVEDCYTQVQVGDLGHLIRLLRQHLHEIGDTEMQRTVTKLKNTSPDNHQHLIEEHTQRLINKILHDPLSRLNKESGAKAAMYATALRRLFDLSQTEDLNQPESTTPKYDPLAEFNQAFDQQEITNGNNPKKLI